MPPTVILIRHAQAQHNYAIPDPPLTPPGLTQCADLSTHLQQHLPLIQKASLIVVSPMLRTLETATHALDFLMARGVPIALRAEWQENSAKPCDTGSPIADMRAAWPHLDWDAVDPVFPRKEGLYEYSQRGLEARGVAARKWLRGRPEEVVVVVSHSGFLRVGVCYRRFENADYRIFDFADEEDGGGEDVGGRLVEWELTEERGGGMGKSPKGITTGYPEDYPVLAEKAEEVEEVASEKPS